MDSNDRRHGLALDLIKEGLDVSPGDAELLRLKREAESKTGRP